jgi:hypothetical protein
MEICVRILNYVNKPVNMHFEDLEPRNRAPDPNVGWLLALYLVTVLLRNLSW